MAHNVQGRGRPILRVHLLVLALSGLPAQDLPPHLVHEDGEPVVEEGVDHAAPGEGVAAGHHGRVGRDQPHGVLTAHSLVGLRGLAVGDGGLDPTSQEVEGVVVPQHHAVDGLLAGVREDELLRAAADLLHGVGGVHDERELPGVAGSSRLKPQGPAPIRRREGVVGHEAPDVDALRGAPVFPRAGNDVACLVGHVIRTPKVGHLRADLLAEPVAQIVDPRVAVDVVLEPRHEEEHARRHVRSLEDRLARRLADEGNEEIMQV
mmetsp:Transcript_38598/g.120106  ORF Transcript_38598/g.120106 Transcript_38598/m.120106 type:complete len:263 (+) Transcript_38598:362-1150(+)